MQTTVDKIFRIFSPSYLFVEGDEIFLPIRQGFFYYLDAIFLCIGAIYIGGKHRAYAWALLALLFVGTLPHIVSTTAGDFSTHLVMLFPFLIIIIGTGIAWTIRSMPHKYRILATLVCIALYACNLTGFTESYFYRAPLTGYDDFPKRVLVKYLQFASARHLPVDVNTATSNDLFQKYMLYANLITRENIPALRTDIIAMSTQFNTIRFLQCADSNKNTPGYTVRV